MEKTKSKNTNNEEFKVVILKACGYLAQYQRDLEAKGKAKEATNVKKIKDDLWNFSTKDNK